MFTDLAALRSFIASDRSLAHLLAVAADRLDDDPGHDLEHALRVCFWTIRLGGGALVPADAIAAGLFHDLVNLPKTHPDRHLASERSAEAAEPILREVGFDEGAIQTIAEAITDHSYSRGATPRSLLGRALQDADRLEALGVLGLFRTISTGTRMNARYFDSRDPWATRRPLDDKRYSVDHFTTKLFKLPETMTTDEGRIEATRRRDRMARMLEDLGDEILEPYVVHANLR